MTEREKFLTEQNQALLEEIKYLREQIEVMNRRLFGKSKESYKKVDVNAGQLSFFDDINNDTVTEEIEQSIIVPSHKRKKKDKSRKERLLKDIPTEIIEHELHGDDCNCPYCKSTLKRIGVSQESIELVYIPAKFKKVIHRQISYECPTCKSDGADTIVKSKLPKMPIKNSLQSPSILANIIYNKYAMYLPLNRQVKLFKGLGLDISKDTMSNGILKVSSKYFKPIYDLLCKKIVKNSVLHADETTYKVINTKKDKCYYWIFRTSEKNNRPIIIYNFANTRSGMVPKEFLKDFRGYLHCDGYSGYNMVENASLVRCLAHVRRKFFESICSGSDENSLPHIMVKNIDRIFSMESEYHGTAYDENKILEVRKKSNKIFKYLIKLAKSWFILSKSKLGNAVKYLLDHAKDILPIFDDARLSLSNNLAERTVRPIAIGRKNWMFSTSEEGAVANGVIMSIMKTAEENGISPNKYIEFLLKTLPYVDLKKPQELEAYLPWSDYVKEVCA